MKFGRDRIEAQPAPSTDVHECDHAAHEEIKRLIRRVLLAMGEDPDQEPES